MFFCSWTRNKRLVSADLPSRFNVITPDIGLVKVTQARPKQALLKTEDRFTGPPRGHAYKRAAKTISWREARERCGSRGRGLGRSTLSPRSVCSSPEELPVSPQNKQRVGVSSGTFASQPSHPDIEALLMTPLTRSSCQALTQTPHPPPTSPTCGLSSWANTPMKTPPACLFLLSLSPPVSSVLNLVDVPQSHTWF